MVAEVERLLPQAPGRGVPRRARRQALLRRLLGRPRAGGAGARRRGHARLRRRTAPGDARRALPERRDGPSRARRWRAAGGAPFAEGERGDPVGLPQVAHPGLDRLPAGGRRGGAQDGGRQSRLARHRADRGQPVPAPGGEDRELRRRPARRRRAGHAARHGEDAGQADADHHGPALVPPPGGRRDGAPARFGPRRGDA